jgi:hypothetical protein
MLFHRDDRLRYEVQKSRTFAKTADPDPRVRLFAAWALCEVGQVNPAHKFDLLGAWRRGPDAVDDEVKAVRAWWVSTAKPVYWEAATTDGTSRPVDPRP